MDYDIKLSIDYDYASPAVGGRHLVCVLPLDGAPGQRVARTGLTIAPHPAERLERRDFFGNAITEFAFHGAHDHVTVTMTARVQRDDEAPQMAGACLLRDLPQALADSRDVGPRSPLHFLSPSIRIPRDPEIIVFARDLDRPDASTRDIVLAVGRAVHKHMTFDSGATTVDTPTAEAFAKARGVCQDFSHVMISCLRALGIPSGYVSGFLRTLPPKGRPRLEGADAMHAWVQAWCGPQAGWMDYDPTNACLVGGDHIVVARGRDYSDVAPIKGTMRIAGRQKSRQAVDVVPV